MPSPIASSRPRRYSTEELLDMRLSHPLDQCVVDKLNKHPDIVHIARLPDGTPRNNNTLSGNLSGLADITNRRNRQQSRMPISDSSDASDGLMMATANRDLRHFQWSFRRRESSDRSTQPHSAPTDAVAQQSENFQRFYRAVVSPTHVRVTAGGRIVPNTRTTAPPAFEWNPDKLLFESNRPAREADSNSQPKGPWVHAAPLPTAFPPLAPGTFMHPGSFFAQSNSFGLAPPPSQQTSFSANQQSPVDRVQSVKPAGDSMNAHRQPLQQITISPPNQFDQSKPFMYNGQLVYPVPPPSTPLPFPMTMLGNPHFVPQHPNGHVNGFISTPHFPYPLANMSNPLAFPSGQHIPMAMAQGILGSEQSPAVLPFIPPLMAPLPSLSELMNANIQVLRNHLKIIDDQLANNKHQVDVKFMQTQRNDVLTQISTMESNLEVQLGQEIFAKGKFPADGISNDRSATMKPQEDYKLASSSRGEKTADYRTKSSVGRSSESSAVPNKIASWKKDSSDQAIRSTSSSKSKLSATAAMAPPFQPRAQAAVIVSSQIQTTKDIMKEEALFPIEVSLTNEAELESEARLSAQATTDWGQPTLPAPVPPALPKSQSMHEKTEPHQPHGLPRSNTFHGSAEYFGQNSTRFISSQAVPYLVGVLRAGIHASEAKASDLTYLRDLTDGEVRARHLYWGKAPRAVGKGLPKFDGKDFYPPSPTKDHTQIAVSAVGAYNGASTMTTDFEQKFNEPEVPRYKTPSPVRFSSNITSFPAQQFMRHGHQEPARATYPVTPPSAGVLVRTTAPDDFYNLFLERGVPGYLSPSPPRPISTRTVDSWGLPTNIKPWNQDGGNSTAVVDEARIEEESNSSTVEIHLTPRRKTSSSSPKPELSGTFAERVASFSNVEQQTLFLQNMLKNTAQKAMTGSAVSGTVSSATAIGYLPQYSGSAAASLAPNARMEFSRESSIAAMLENRPPSQSMSPFFEGLGAEAYMRFLTQKVEDKKIIEQGWNASTTGTGPVMGSDW